MTTDWGISGYNLISSDSHYQIVQAIMRNNMMTDEEKIPLIQKGTGTNAPVEINHKHHRVEFYRY